MRIMKSKKGFTLIELIIVIAILAVVAAIAIPLIANHIKDAKIAAAKTDAKNMYTSLTALMTKQDTDENLTKIYRWCDNNGQKITYIGPTDNSVTNPRGYHDEAKNAVKDIMGSNAIQFGYRLYVQKNGNEHQVSKIEIFIDAPTKAAITAATPDIVYNGIE